MSDFLHVFKFRWIFLLLGILLFPDLRAQQSVGIGTSTPNPNAILDIKSDKQGLLVPRLNSTQKAQMAQILQSSAGNDGMIVFDTDQGKFYYWFGGKWNEGLGALASSTVEGDLQGNLPSPLVVGLQGRAMSSVAPSNNQVLKWNGSVWTPAPDIGVDYIAGAGIQIVNGQIINSGDLNASDDLLKTDIAGGDLSGTFNNLAVRTSAINTVKIADQAVTSAKIANQNITTEKIADEAVTLDKINAGSPNSFLSIAADGTLLWESKNGIMNSALSEGYLLIGSSAGVAQQRSVSGDLTIDAAGEATISDNSISSSNIVDGGIVTVDIANDAITKDKVAADLAGAGLVQETDGSISVNPGTGLSITGDNLNLANTGVTSGLYGQNNKVAQFSVDAQGRIVAVSELDIAASPAGVAGGELNGSYPNPTIRDGVITQTKIANDAVGLPQIKNDDPNMMMITDPSGNPRWFEPFANQVIITGNDGRISSESRSAFSTPSLPPGNVFVGSSGGIAMPLSANATGHILIGNGSGLSSVDVSGDIDMTITGSAIIQPGVINNTKIANGAVNSAKIEDGSIATIDIQNASVANTKLSADAVTTDKIADGTISDDDLNKIDIPLSGFGVAAANVDLGSQKLISVADPTNSQDAATKNYVDTQITSSTSLTEGNVYVGDNTNTASAVDGSTSGNILVGDGTTVNSVGVSGDLTLAADGTATIGTNAVTTVKIIDNAITSAKIADGTVGTADLADGGTTNAKVAANAISTDKIVDGTIINADLAASSVNSSNIVDESISNEDLADNAVTTDKISDATITDADLNKTAIPLSGFGAAAANLDLGANELTNVAEPTQNTSAATKNYVDTQITSSTSLTEGSVYVGDNTNTASAVDGSTSGNILVGDGTTVNSVGVSGDLTLAADGTATIEDGAVTSTKILDSSIANSDLAANSVNSNNIVDESIANEDLAADAVTTDKISDATISNADLNKTAIPLSGFGAAAADVDLGANELTNVAEPTQNTSAATKNYVDTQITSSTSLTEGSVYVGDNTNTASAVDGSTSGNILVGDGTTVNSVGVTGDLTLAADGTATIGNNAVTTVKIIDNAITSAKIADGTVGTADLADGGTTNAKVAADAISTDKIVDGTIINADLGTDAVTSAKILDATITDADLNKTAIPLSGFGAAAADVDLGANELTNVGEPTQNTSAATKNYVDTQITSSTSLTEGSVYVGDNTNTASAVDGSTSGNILVGDGTTVNSVGVSGDLTLAADGTATITNNAVTTTKIINSAVTSAKIADGTIITADLADGVITNSKIGADAITTAKIDDGTIINADLAADIVTTDKIADGTIADADLNKTVIPLSGFGAAASEVNLGSQKLVSVADPTNAQDAATKKYVDDQITGSTTLAEGHVYIGDNSNSASAVDGKTSGNIFIGDGTTVNSVGLGGDITLAANGTTTIEEGVVNSGKILDGTIVNVDLAANAVNSGNIVNGSIVNEDIAADAVTSDKIADGTIADADLNKTAIPLSGFGAATAEVNLGSQKLVSVADPTNGQDAATKSYVDGLITTDGDKDAVNEIQALSLTGDDLILSRAGGTVDLNSYNNIDEIVATSGLSGGGTTSSVSLGIAAGGVTSSHLQNGTVINEDIADNTINFEKIERSGAAAGQVMVWSSLSGKWVPGNANSILGGGDIIEVETAPGSGLQGGEISGIASLSLTNSGAGEILIGDGTNVNATTITGDISLSSTGVTTINNNTIENANISDGAVSTAKIVDGAITAQKIDQMAATSGDVIKWNGTSWAPAADNVNDLDFDPTNEIQDLSISGNTISLTGSASINVSTSSPTENQVLTYKSGAWKAENPAVAGTITRTGFYSVDPLDFQGVGKDGAQKIYYHGSSPAGAFVATDETSGIASPIHLPHGATVTSVSFYFYDSDGGAGRNMNFLFQRKARASGTSENMGTYQTSGGAGAGNATVSTISNGIIDNSLFTYRVVVEMDKDGYDSAMRHRVYSVIVEYTEVF